MPRFKHTAHRVSLTAMFSAMSLVFLFLASVLPAGRVVCYFLSSVFVMGLVLEEELGLAWLMFAVVSALSLLLMPNSIQRVVPYVLFFGHYGIGKYYIQTRVRDKVMRYILKLLYYNAALVLMYLLAREVLEQDVLDLAPFWVVIIIAEISFVVYDYAYTKATSYYFNNIRRLLMKS